jgi:hypothetical protein
MILQRACLESNPLRKAREIIRGLMRVRALCVSQFLGSADVGEDEFMPVQIAYFYIANQPYMVSNFVFLHEVCLGHACEMAFQGMVVPPVSVLAAICENVPGSGGPSSSGERHNCRLRVQMKPGLVLDCLSLKTRSAYQFPNGEFCRDDQMLNGFVVLPCASLWWSSRFRYHSLFGIIAQCELETHRSCV